MIDDSSRQMKPTCIIPRYSRGWALGTGLGVSLPPGRYRITGKDSLQGANYFRLEGRYRIDSCLCANRRN